MYQFNESNPAGVNVRKMRNLENEKAKLSTIITENSHYRHYAVNGEWVRDHQKIKATAAEKFGQCVIRLPLGFLVAIPENVHIQSSADDVICKFEGRPVIAEGRFVIERYDNGDFHSYTIK